MSSFHSTIIPIHHGHDSQGYFSLKDPDKLIVFVHGFGGNAISTWNSFPTLLLQDESFSESDIIFYGYKTLEGQAGDHSTELYHFLTKMIEPVKNNILPSNQNLQERGYKRIFLIAHSLGAIIVRQALLTAYYENQNWLQTSNLILFAPAHKGASVVSLALKALPGIWAFVGAIAKFKYPVLSDLDAEDEGIIKSISEQTINLQNQNKGDFTKARLVVFAKGDKIVKNIPYPGDKAAIDVDGVSHMTVCKPKIDYMIPFNELKKII